MASRSETAKLLASLELKDKFSPAVRNADKALGKFDANLDRTSSRAYKAGQQIGTGLKRGAILAAGAAGIVAFQVQQGLDSLIELEQQTAQTNAVIKSTGGVAGVTADEVGRLAEKYEALNATVGDEVIREGQNLLLTFTNIKDKAFEPALAAILDMNTALGKGPEGLTSTVKVVGKALNDPTKGLSALSRVGITFSKEQAKRIKQLQEEGKLYEAQGIIIGELDKRFGGSFLAQGDTTAGSVAKLSDAIEDSQRALAEGMLPAVRNVADALTELIADPEIKNGIKQFGDSLGQALSKENIKEGARIIGDVVKAVAAAAPTIASGLSTAAGVIGTVISAFQKLPPEVQQLAVGAFAVNKLTGGLVTNIAGGIFGALKSMTVTAGHVTVVGPGGGSPLGNVGGLGGGAGAAAGAGAAGLVGITAALVAIPAAVAGLGIILGRIVDPTGSKTRAGKAETATARGIPDANNKNLDRVRDEVKAQRSVLTSIEANVLRTGERTAIGLDETKAKVSTAVDMSKQLIAQKQAETTRETQRGATQTQATQRSTAASIAASQAIAASSIVAAIYAARPIISVTNVTRTYNRTTNYGPAEGSRNKKTADSNYGPM